MQPQISSTSDLRSESDRSPGAPAVDRVQLLALIEPVVASHGAELCDVELKNENGWVLRVHVERAGAKAHKLSTKDAAVDLDRCAEISRDLSAALDLADPIPQAYQLEVGSPGVERPLHTAADFDRFLGEKAKLKLRAPVLGQKVLVGKLAALDSHMVTVQDGAKTYPVPLEDIASARLVFEFGPSPKPGGPERARSTKTPKKRK